MPKSLKEWIEEKTAHVPEVASIPIEQAAIGWDLDRERGDTRNDLTVLDYREIRQGGEQRAVWDRAGSTSGAAFAEWKEGRNPRYTPLGMLAEMGFDGTLPKGADFARVLQEFAKIEGCDWALHMIAALHMGHFVDNRDDEMWE